MTFVCHGLLFVTLNTSNHYLSLSLSLSWWCKFIQCLKTLRNKLCVICLYIGNIIIILVICSDFITSSCWTGKRSNCLKILQGYVFIFLNAEPALHLLDEAIATPRQPLHTASSLLRTVGTPTPLRQQPISALRHSACKYGYTLSYSCTCVVMMYKLIKS